MGRMPETSVTPRAGQELGATADVGAEALGRENRLSRRDAFGRLALLGGDLVVVVVCLFAVTLMFEDSSFLPAWVAAFLPVYALLAKMAGLYDRDQFILHKTTLDETPALVAVSAIFALFVEGVQAVQYTGGSHPLPLWAILSVGLVLMRGLVRFVTVRVSPTERVLVVGDASTTAAIRRKLAQDPSLNATVVGRVGTNGNADRPDKVLGTVEDLPGVLTRHRVDRVVIAPTHHGGEDVVDIIRLATGCGVKVAVLPRLLEVIGSAVEFDDLGGHVLLGVRDFGLSPSSRALKRSFDVLTSTALLVVLAPVIAAIAVAIKLSSPGSVLFRQTRVGRQGDEFLMLKFRTMVTDADQLKHELLDLNEAGPMFKIPNDPRSTRIGRFLRRRSLDELPQLFNVLRGDMSLVGPRPLIPEEDRLFSGWQRRRHHVAPGITGPWQILGSTRVPVNDMVTIDYLYCANWSLWLDAKILVRTIPYVLSRRSPEFGA
jgi:exopolysaccharide biosynthesis polyprenyl glycosylphosphotransferase